MIEAVGQNYLKKYFQKIKKIYLIMVKLQFKRLQLMIIYMIGIKKKKILFKNIFFPVVFYLPKKKL